MRISTSPRYDWPDVSLTFADYTKDGRDADFLLADNYRSRLRV